MEQDAQAKATRPPTPEITLRRPDLSDVYDFMVWSSDDKVSRFCRWDTYTSTDALLAYMKESVLPHPWFRAICVAGRPVGAISVSLGTGENRCRGELGYVLASAYWGKGITTAAVRMVLGTVFGDVEGLERVEALVDVENKASQKVVEKAGFRKEGVFRRYYVKKGQVRDVIVYGFISSDPLV